MPKFLIDPQDTYREWTIISDFKSKNRLVDFDGKAISHKHQGRQYHIVEKRLKEFPIFKRIARLVLGCFLILASAGLAYKFKSVRALLKRGDTVRLGRLFAENYETAYKRAREELEAGMELPAEIKGWLKDFWDGKPPSPGIEYQEISKNLYRVFELVGDKLPSCIYKANGITQSVMQRFHNMVESQLAIRAYFLDRLVVPHARLHINTCLREEKRVAKATLVEKKLDVHKERRPLEDETVRQLALFICKTGYWDTRYDNNPIMASEGDQRVALLDLERLDDPVAGLRGCFGNPGLLHLIPSSQNGIVRRVMEQQDSSVVKSYRLPDWNELLLRLKQ